MKKGRQGEEEAGRKETGRVIIVYRGEEVRVDKGSDNEEREISDKRTHN